jgi:hypothetical protein
MKVSSLKLFVVAMAAAVTTWAAAQETLNKPVLEKGAVYRYQDVDLLKNEVTRTVEHTVLFMLGDDSVVLLESVDGGSPRKRRLDVTNHIFFRPDRKGTWEAIRFPLSVGDTWQYQYSNPSSERPGLIFASDIRAKFVGWEEVKVPAGTFRAAKIEHHGTWTPSSGQRGGREAYTFWYSPDVKRFVKEVQVAYEPWGSPIYFFERRLIGYQPALSSQAPSEVPR